jgi:hypothetical protein
MVRIKREEKQKESPGSRHSNTHRQPVVLDLRQAVCDRLCQQKDDELLCLLAGGRRGTSLLGLGGTETSAVHGEFHALMRTAP